MYKPNILHMKPFLIVIILLSAMTTKAQQSVTLNDGRVINGQILEITKMQMVIQIDSVTKDLIPMKDVAKYYDGTNLIRTNDKTVEMYNKAFSTGGDELKKASDMLTTGIAISLVGILTSTAVPYLIPEPKLENNDYIKFNEDEKKYKKTIKGIVLGGCGITLIGTIVELSSLGHFKLAGQKFDAKFSAKGVGISMKF